MQYLELARRSELQRVFFEINQLPTTTPDSNEVIISFRIANDFLTFLKINELSDVSSDSTRGFEYYTRLEMALEVSAIDSTELADAMESDNRKGLLNRGPRKRPSDPEANRNQWFTEDESDVIPNAQYRTFWKKLILAENSKQSTSSTDFIQGYFSLVLPVGFYTYTVVLKETGATREKTGRKRRLRVKRFGGEEIFSLPISSTQNSQGHWSLLNLGNNCFYGQDFSLMIFSKAPMTDKRVRVLKPDSDEAVYEYVIKRENLIAKEKTPNFSDSLHTEFDLREGAYAAYQIDIPASRFQNGRYRLLVEGNQDKPLDRFSFQTLWRDMPISLYNIDVALSMLEFILKEDMVREMMQGSEEEKIESFRSFWAKRDPSAETEYNELMNEYYRRIDFAFLEYSTLNTPGFRTDQGKVYIRRGPPKSVRREFPPGQSPLEIWTYPDKEIRFQATSGFGEFKQI